ncbi:hypothetical protein GCM10010404_21420 [Nonomuraea africana]|uniref:Uncharacterized protein n=1 Tax=Nonomuraea africana TaxID=46171 RepID=A0ABR9KTQ0_9ACTN|nr:hypothetical protein [Nonomuraea africana]
MRGQESGSEHERETDGSAAPATPPPSFGRPAVRTEPNVPPAYPGGSHPSHGDALAEPPFADFSGPGAVGVRPIPVFQGPPPGLPTPEPAPDLPTGFPSPGTEYGRPNAEYDRQSAEASPQGMASPAPGGGAPSSGGEFPAPSGAFPGAGGEFSPHGGGLPPQGGELPAQGADATAEHARLGLPLSARPLPAFPGVPAESWTQSAQPWEHGADDQPYDWFSDPEPDADPSRPTPQQPAPQTPQQPNGQWGATTQPQGPQDSDSPWAPSPAWQPAESPQGQWQPAEDAQQKWQAANSGPDQAQPADSPQEPWPQGVEPVVPGAPPWQPPPGFTAAAAGMKVWPSPDDAPAMPPWPAATGEPIDAHGDDEPLDPSMTVPFGQSAEPGDVPVWPPVPADEEADDRIPDLPFDSSTWGRPKDGETSGDVLDDAPAAGGGAPQEPARAGDESAFAPGGKHGDSPQGGDGPARFHGAIPLPAAESAPAPGDGTFPQPAVQAPGGQPPSVTPAQGPPTQGTTGSPNLPPNGPRTGPQSGPQNAPPRGPQSGPQTGPQSGPPMGASGLHVAELPTPPHGAPPVAPFDPFAPMPPGGLVPPPAPPAKAGKGKKAMLATLGVLVLAGVATGGFFAYRSMNAGSPSDASSGLTAQPSVSTGPGAVTESNSLLDSEGSDPEKMSVNEAFPDKEVEVGGRVYTRVKVDMSDDCKQAATGPFATALQDQKCSRVLRATYVDSKKRYAITTGIAVLPTKEAAAAADQAKDLGKNLWFRPLPGSASSGADRVHIAGGYAAGLLWGRYIVFSYATYADGHTPTAKEKGLGTVSGAFRDHTSLVLERRITE